MTDPLRLMSWNIHGGVGLDGRYDLDRVIAVIARNDPDVLCLQEIDTRRGRADKLDRLGALIGGHLAEARTATAPDGHYGHVVISRWPLADVHAHDLSVGRREPRAAIEATVETPHGPLHLLSVHLGLDILERRRQAAVLRAVAARSDAPVGVVIGDFNDWIWPAPVERALAPVLPGRTAHRTFPARMPVFKLDRVYVRPAGALLSSRLDTAGRIASDHLPLIVGIDPAAR